MNGMLAPGTPLTTTEGVTLEVAELLGSGGQGEVYRVLGPGGPQALKWYFPACATDQQDEIVQQLVARNLDDDRFLWPSAHVRDDTGFGYVMPLLPDRFRKLTDLFRRTLHTSPRALLAAALNTVEAYQVLHAQGIAYRDISWGNVVFDPANGDVLICDNDNAVVEGENSGITGTMHFMAPELVRADPGARPGTQSDLHSLAVLLFMLLMNHHPLSGRRELEVHCLDEAAERRLYGREPVFVFDPKDRSNAPDPQEQGTVLATWEAACPSLRELFTRNFTEGLHEPARRVRESEWRDALRAAYDAVVECAHCGRQNMTEPGSGDSRPCWRCGQLVTLPARLTVTTLGPRVVRHISLHRTARLQAHHLEAEPARHDYGDATLVGMLTEHPKQPGRFGLTNRSTQSWTAERRDGSRQSVDPGQTIPLRAGLSLDLAAAHAVVETV
ncbi:protein kinase domain-containing protein [Streptomyces sp. P6-2-1]|uniref:protein kinase domain-containing protein n=1 Tax=Streptomyces sp. P6-2-1 TaxID=3422591 RepID=UPI003D36E896